MDRVRSAELPEWIPTVRRPERQYRNVHRYAAADPRLGRRSQYVRQLRRPTCLGRSSDGDMAQSRGIRARTGLYVRQSAAHASRRTLTGTVVDVVGRRGVHQGPPRRLDEGGPAQARSAQPVQPRQRPRAPRRWNIRELELRPDEYSGRVHADHADHVPVFVLRWGSAPHPGSVARGGPVAPLRSLAGAPCAPKRSAEANGPSPRSPPLFLEKCNIDFL